MECRGWWIPALPELYMQMRYGIACRRGGDVEEEVEYTVDCVLNGQSR